MATSILCTIWMERNARTFEDTEVDEMDLFEIEECSASLWASADKAFKDFPFTLIVSNWKNVIGF